MDEAKADELGFEPIQDDLKRIFEADDKAALPPGPGRASSARGRRGLFGFYVDNDAKQSDRYIVYLGQGGLSLPDESYYRDDKFQPIREKFVTHVEKMSELADAPDPKDAAARVIDVETKLAKHHWDRVKSRDATLTYNKKTLKELGRAGAGVRLDGASSRPSARPGSTR